MFYNTLEHMVYLLRLILKSRNHKKDMSNPTFMKLHNVHFSIEIATKMINEIAKIVHPLQFQAKTSSEDK